MQGTEGSGIRRVLLITLATIWAIAILWAAGLPHAPAGSSGMDKLLHALGFGVLASMLFLVQKKSTPRWILTVSIIVTIYGIIIETYQHMLPTRSFSWLDMLANISGITAGITMTYALKPVLKRSRVKST